MSGWLLGSGLGRGRRSILVLAAIAALAFLVRLLPVLLGGGLTGLNGYDDGVYMAAAIAISEGVMPYRDFLLLHPPGEPVALVPFALLGRVLGDDVGFALARLATMCLGAVGAVLAAMAAGRHLRLAGIAAGVMYATWNVAANADRSTDLHTIQGVLVLVSLLIIVVPGRIGPGRAVLAGVPVGLATSVQLWQGLTVAILLVWIAVRAPAARTVLARLQPPIAFGMASVAAFAVVCLPFLVAAPGAMIRYTLVDQVGRAATGASPLERLRALEGLPRTTQLPTELRSLVPDVAVLAVAIAAVAAAAWTAWRLPWTRPWAVLALATGGLVLLTPSFYNDYAALVAPFAVLVLGAAFGAIAATAIRRATHRGAVVALAAVIVAVSTVLSVGHPEGDALDVAGLAQDTRDRTCVAADRPTLLVVSGALRRGIAAGCPVSVDPTGIRHDGDRTRMPGGRPAPSLRRSPAYQEAMQAWYGSVDAALLATDGSFTDETRAVIERHLPESHERGVVTVRWAMP